MCIHYCTLLYEGKISLVSWNSWTFLFTLWSFLSFDWTVSLTVPFKDYLHFLICFSYRRTSIKEKENYIHDFSSESQKSRKRRSEDFSTNKSSIYFQQNVTSICKDPSACHCRTYSWQLHQGLTLMWKKTQNWEVWTLYPFWCDIKKEVRRYLPSQLSHLCGWGNYQFQMFK